MILFTFVTFSAIVILIAIVTHKMNAPTPCDHDWKETEMGLQCTKCNRRIQRHDHYLSQEVPVTGNDQLRETSNAPGLIHQRGIKIRALQKE
jgi:hypothetical protein